MASTKIANAFIPELYDAVVLRTLEDNLVLKEICKAPIKSPIKQYGDTVYFGDLADPTITSNSMDSLSPEDLQDSQISMLIDTTETFCYKVRDIDQMMANVDLKGSQAQRAGYSLRDKVERAVFQTIGDGANAGTALTATITPANVISYLGELSLMLEDNNVTPENMFMLVPPWIRLYLKEAGISFEINNGIHGTGGLAWTDELGFARVYVTNTVYNAGTQATPISTVLAGSYQAIGYADMLVPTRDIELAGSRATQLDGGLVYGKKLILPKQLAKGTFTKGAVTTL
jgi:hypothetical protein